MLHSLISLQLKVNPGVDAALAEVAVERAIVAELLEQLAKVAEVGADAVGRHGRILPPLPGVLLAGDAGGRAQARLADFPQVFFLGLVVEELHGRRVAHPLQMLHQLAGLVVRFVLALTAELDQEPAPPFGQQGDVPGVDALLLHVSHEDVVESLQPGRLELHDLRDVVPRAVDVGVAKNQDRLDGRAVDQVQGGLQDRDARPLGARECPGDVEPLLRQ